MFSNLKHKFHGSFINKPLQSSNLTCKIIINHQITTRLRILDKNVHGMSSRALNNHSKRITQ